jgi:CheY-like chemotaxis protein
MPRIVIVEEDKLMRDLLVEWLSAEGYSVRAVANGDIQPKDKPDLVIVDVYMPRREGSNRLREIQAANPDAPVIAISGQFRPGLAGSSNAARALGVRRVIAKPCSRRELIAAVHDVIGTVH